MAGKMVTQFGRIILPGLPGGGGAPLPPHPYPVPAPAPAPLPPNPGASAPAPPSRRIGGIGGIHITPPQPHPIPIDAPVPPTITLGQGHTLSGDPGYVSATGASAGAGNPTGVANLAVLTLAQRLQTQAVYVMRFVGVAAANEILTGAHLVAGI